MIKAKRWPLKADYKPLANADVVALINAFGAIRDLECLRSIGNFRHVSFIKPRCFDPTDQHYALCYIVDAINAMPDDSGMAGLGLRFQRVVGALDRPVAVRLHGWPYVVQSKPALRTT